MVIELTPENFFEHINKDGPLHIVMHYGANCGPCKKTMPIYDIIDEHFASHNITNVKFYKFHQWEPEYKQFIEDYGLKTHGVPTFKYFYMQEVINEETRSFVDPNELKKHIIDTITAIEKTTGGFNLYENL